MIQELYVTTASSYSRGLLICKMLMKEVFLFLFQKTTLKVKAVISQAWLIIAELNWKKYRKIIR